MTILDATSTPHELGFGYWISAPGVVGDAQVQLPTAGGLHRSGGTTIDDVLVDHEIGDIAEIELDITSLALPPASRGGDPIVIAVPDLGPDVGQVLLGVDPATGLLSWHFPERGPAGSDAATRGGTLQFVLRGESRAASAPSTSRGVLGWIGKKLLRVLVYPVTDVVTGAAIHASLSAWERRARPHGVRQFGPGALKKTEWTALDGAGWQRLSAGRALLFVHGTFSTGVGAFGALSDGMLTDLSGEYGGRVASFEHPTLSVTPEENAKWLVDQLETVSTHLDVDIVCHSRGGLVSRVLAERMTSARLQVRRIVLVGVPNGGTPLADPEHMTDLLDQMTNLGSGVLGDAATAAATGQAGDVLEAVLAVVKVLGRGLLLDASGLEAMAPRGEFITTLNAVNVATDRYFAVCSDHEPMGSGVAALARKALDAAMDRVFLDAPNDCVVPTEGMHTAGKLMIAPEHRVELIKESGVLHTQYFGSVSVASRLLELLRGS